MYVTLKVVEKSNSNLANAACKLAYKQAVPVLGGPEAKALYLPCNAGNTKTHTDITCH